MRVLVLGGTGFLGLQLLAQLDALPDLRLHCVNRGNKYWNHRHKQFSRVHFHYGNRHVHQDYERVLAYVSQRAGVSDKDPWDLVVDFCAFKPKHVRSVHRALSGKLRLYVFISSDSVYEVCDPRLRTKGEKVPEDKARRPESERRARQLAEDDSYGHKKLLAEEYLYETKSPQFPFIALRLADVFGPFDGTGRFWAYVKWILRHQSTRPLEVGRDELGQRLSFAFSGDVVSLLLRLVEDPLPQQCYFQSYNLAYPEGVTIVDFVTLIGQSLGRSLHFVTNERGSRNFYPSVLCGALDVTRAERLLGWRTRPIEQAVRESVLFFARAEGQYLREEEDVDQMLHRKLGL